MRPLGYFYLGAIRQQHPYRNFQPPPGWVDDRDRAVSPLRPADDLKASTMERMEWVEDLDMRIFRAQGTVGVGVFILTSTVYLLPGVSLRITPVGFPRATPSFFPSRCSAVSSAASSSPDLRPPSAKAHSSSTATSCLLRNRALLPPGCGACSAMTGSSIPSGLSEDRNTRCAISERIHIAWLSPTAGWSLSPRATSPSAGETPHMVTSSAS